MDGLCSTGSDKAYVKLSQARLALSHIKTLKSTKRLKSLNKIVFIARQRLRSSSSSSLIVSRTRLPTVGDRVAAARVWNSLPDLITSAPSVAVFRSRLKTHLFNISYPCDYTVPAQ